MSAEPQLSPAEANRMLDCIRTKATRLQAIEEALQAPLTRDTREALRRRYLAETDAADR